MRSQQRRAHRAAASGRALAWVLVLVGCASPRRGARPGEASSSGWLGAPFTSASAPAPSPRAESWPLAEALRPLQPVGRRARSDHLGGDCDGEVLAGAASYPPRGPASVAAAGTTVIERLFPLDGAGPSDDGAWAGKSGSAPIVYFVMVKRAPGYNPSGGDWEYLVVAPDGRVEDRGQVALCARCHAEAPHDFLFGAGGR